MNYAKIKKIIAIIIAIAIFVLAISLYFADYNQAKKYFPLAGENPALFLAIAKAESNFCETAISEKGAMGLCQIMPKTAEWCCEQMGITYDKNMLLTAEYNAKIANFYIEYLLEKFDKTSAICAYNAGEGNVSTWLKNQEYSKNGKLENIPFEETKNYLKKVQTNEKKFQTYIKLFRWQ